MQVCDLLKLLSDETRLRVLMLLRSRTLCVSQIRAILKLPQSTLSKHLAKLREANLVETQQDGKFIKYHLADHYLLKMILYDIYLESKETQFEKDFQEIKYVESLLDACERCSALEMKTK